MFRKPEIGLALGAGGARGLAHVGVLKGLEKSGVRLSAICGTSIGAFIGGIYAAYLSAHRVEQILQNFLSSKLYEKAGLAVMKQAFHDQPETLSQRLQTFIKKTYIRARMVTSEAILDPATYMEIIEFLVPDLKIENLPIPFCAMSTDLITGKPVLFKKGSLRDAIHASTAIPGVIAPFYLHDMMLTDGGVLNTVPVLPLLEMDLDMVLAVDLDPSLLQNVNFNSAVDILFRAEDIEGDMLKNYQINLADFVLTPNVGHIHWSDFLCFPETIRLGQDELFENLDKILSLSKRRNFPIRRLIRPRPKLPAQWTDWIEI